MDDLLFFGFSFEKMKINFVTLNIKIMSIDVLFYMYMTSRMIFYVFDTYFANLNLLFQCIYSNVEFDSHLLIRLDLNC